jgi:hypothetical protein
MPHTIQILLLGAPAPEAIYRAYALQPGDETQLAEGLGNEKDECKLEYAWSCGKIGMRLYLRCRFAQLFRVRSSYP